MFMFMCQRCSFMYKCIYVLDHFRVSQAYGSLTRNKFNTNTNTYTCTYTYTYNLIQTHIYIYTVVSCSWLLGCSRFHLLIAHCYLVRSALKELYDSGSMLRCLVKRKSTTVVGSIVKTMFEH